MPINSVDPSEGRQGDNCTPCDRKREHQWISGTSGKQWLPMAFEFNSTVLTVPKLKIYLILILCIFLL